MAHLNWGMVRTKVCKDRIGYLAKSLSNLKAVFGARISARCPSGFDCVYSQELLTSRGEHQILLSHSCTVRIYKLDEVVLWGWIL